MPSGRVHVEFPDGGRRAGRASRTLRVGLARFRRGPTIATIDKVPRRPNLLAVPSAVGVLMVAVAAVAGTAGGFTTPTTSTTTEPLGLVAETTTTTSTTTTTTTTTSTLPSLVAVTTTSTAPVTTASLPLAAVTTTTTTDPTPDEADVPIGVIDTSGVVPPGLDLAAVPGAPQAPPHVAGDDDLSAGPGCAYQCIVSGVAYPRGFGVELVVETRVPADLMLIVTRDGDADGDYEFTEYLESDGRVTHYSGAVDHLDPGTTYYVTLTATDEYADVSYAFGQFTTLSERTVHLVVDDVGIIGGPTNIEHTDMWFIVDGDYWDVDGEGWELTHLGLDRHADLALRVYREWEVAWNTECEGSYPESDPPSGDDDGRCETWNTASENDLDLDVIPPNRSRWTSVSFARTLTTPTGEGDPLPPGHGDPRYFDITVSMSFAVTYS